MLQEWVRERCREVLREVAVAALQRETRQRLVDALELELLDVPRGKLEAIVGRVLRVLAGAVR